MSRSATALLFMAVICMSRLCHGQTDVKVPAKVLAQMDFFVGTWETEGKMLGQESRGASIIRWAPGKHCLISNVKSNLMTATGVVGWDPTTNEIVETWYRADGYRIEQRINRFSASGWEGTSVVQDPSGKVMNGKIRVERAPDGKSFTFSTSVDDKTTLEGTYRRVEQKAKKN